MVTTNMGFDLIKSKFACNKFILLILRKSFVLSRIFLVEKPENTLWFVSWSFGNRAFSLNPEARELSARCILLNLHRALMFSEFPSFLMTNKRDKTKDHLNVSNTTLFRHTNVTVLVGTLVSFLAHDTTNLRHRKCGRLLARLPSGRCGEGAVMGR